MTSKDFVYTKVYICGPKKWSIFYIPHIELIYYHFIHFDQFGNVVIVNDGNQFKRFEKTVQSDLHQKPGGELNLTFRKNDHDYLLNDRSLYEIYKIFYYLLRVLVFQEDKNPIKRQYHRTSSDNI